MAEVSLRWAVISKGWALCGIADEQAAVDIRASRVRAGPVDLLTAVARVVLGYGEARAELEAEPTTFRWIFRPAGDAVDIQILELPDFHHPDGDGTQIWASRPPIGTLARAVIRAFDDVASQHGDDGYRDIWGEPFPRTELEALRRAWRNRAGIPPGAR